MALGLSATALDLPWAVALRVIPLGLHAVVPAVAALAELTRSTISVDA